LTTPLFPEKKKIIPFLPPCQDAKGLDRVPSGRVIKKRQGKREKVKSLKRRCNNV